MNTLFPLITEYNEEFKEYYTYRQVYFKWNINSEAFHLLKRYNDFPDSSYYWVYPKGQEPREKHVLFGTYYIQHKIWKHQFPATCEDKKFLIAPLWFAGIGSIIHILARSLALAIAYNRILVVYSNNRIWGDRVFCDDDNQSLLCYLQPMTNCSIPISNVNKFIHTNNLANFSDFFISKDLYYNEYPNKKYIIMRRCMTQHSIPSYVHVFMKLYHFQISENWYWRIQAATFITRLNERTVNWIREYEKEHCKNCKNEYDISLYILHGDKGKEMKLVNANVYKEATNIITSLGMKKNYTVYVNADDQESVDAIHTLPYIVTSFNQSRHNYGLAKILIAPHTALISFAGLYNQIRADHSVGTIGSNWNRLIYELKSTVGMKSDGFIFEVNQENCISYSQCASKSLSLYTGER